MVLTLLIDESAGILNSFEQNHVCLQRKSKDLTVNVYCNLKLELCKASNTCMFIINGRLGNVNENMAYICKDKSLVYYTQLCSVVYSKCKF